jgi:hypothetical protein
MKRMRQVQTPQQRRRRRRLRKLKRLLSLLLKKKRRTRRKKRKMRLQKEPTKTIPSQRDSLTDRNGYKSDPLKWRMQSKRSPISTWRTDTVTLMDSQCETWN